MKGSYILIIKLDKDKTIQIGKKQQKIFFKKGYYAYIGSAMNGLEQRINRHLRKNKKFHWHIDYLLEHSKIEKIYYLESTKRKECEIAKKFNQEFENISDFGCSDCKCKSHLFYSDRNHLIKNIERVNMINFDF
jgi:Uri superfamily endonuclease